MKIVVINLASEDARWIAVTRQFRAVGLEPTRVEAICGKALAPREVRRLYSEELNRVQYHKRLLPGEIGCYASHISVWQQLLESSDPHVAVFEDDVDVDADLPETLAAIERAPAQWDLIKLIGRQREKATTRFPLTLGRDLVEYRRVPGLTSAYVIDRRGAEKLLSRRVPFGRPIDIDLRHWWELDLRILGVHPYPVHLAPSSLLSTIEGRRTPTDARTRLHKTLLQARYTVRNWQATHGGVPAARPRHARQPGPLADHPSP